MDVANQVMIIYAAINNMLDDVPVSAIREFERQFYIYMEDHYSEITKEIHETGQLSESAEKLLRRGVEEFKKAGFING